MDKHTQIIPSTAAGNAKKIYMYKEKSNLNVYYIVI